MFVGVAVGWELARELEGFDSATQKETDDGHPLSRPRLLRAERAATPACWSTRSSPAIRRPAPRRRTTWTRRTSSSRTGTQDHYGDIVEIAKRTGAQCVAIVEIAGELGEQGVENVSDPNIGGTVEFDGGWVRLTPAWHTLDHARRAR